MVSTENRHNRPIKNGYWHTLPVHLISPHVNLPDTHIKHFSHSTSENTLLPVTYVWHLHAGRRGTTPIHLQFSNCRRPVRTPLQHSLPPVSHTVLDHRLRSFWIYESLSIIFHRIKNKTALVALRLPLDTSSSCTDVLIHMH